MNASFSKQTGALRRSVTGTMALAAVLGVCCAVGSAPVRAAVTTGRVFGHAPVGATVLVSNPEYGIHRRSTADAKGRYLVTWLPIGVYTVTVVDNWQPVVRHPSVQLFVDRGSRVDFSCPYGRCAEVAAN